MHTHTHARTHALTDPPSHTHAARTHARTHARTRTHAHTHTHTPHTHTPHTHTHTHTLPHTGAKDVMLNDVKTVGAWCKHWGFADDLSKHTLTFDDPSERVGRAFVHGDRGISSHAEHRFPAPSCKGRMS